MTVLTATVSTAIRSTSSKLRPPAHIPTETQSERFQERWQRKGSFSACVWISL